MKITANGYEYQCCECDEPDEGDDYRLIGDSDYQFCDHCHRPIAGTATTHTETDE